MRQTKSLAFVLVAIVGSVTAVFAPQATAKPFCPPGLQKKHDGCLPPGQAKTYHSDDDYGRHEWRRGDPIGRYPYVIVRDYDRYHLPPPPNGTIYVAVGGELLRVDPRTLEVIGLVGLLSNLLR